MDETRPALLFSSGQFVGPMCLPEPKERLEAGFLCTTAGWGRTAEGKNFYATSFNQISERSGG